MGVGLPPSSHTRPFTSHPSPRAKGFRKLLSLKELVGETNLVFREDAVRLGLFVGGFTAFHEFLRGVVAHMWQGKQDTVSRYGELRNDREMCVRRERCTEREMLYGGCTTTCTLFVLLHDLGSILCT